MKNIIQLCRGNETDLEWAKPCIGEVLYCEDSESIYVVDVDKKLRKIDCPQEIMLLILKHILEGYDISAFYNKKEDAIPENLLSGEIAYCLDTNELYIGNSVAGKTTLVSPIKEQE